MFKFETLRLAPLTTMNGFNLVPSAFAAKQTEATAFSFPVEFKTISWLPTLETVVVPTISYHTGVSSIA